MCVKVSSVVDNKDLESKGELDDVLDLIDLRGDVMGYSGDPGLRLVNVVGKKARLAAHQTSLLQSSLNESNF
jgi:hypothetical protein